MNREAGRAARLFLIPLALAIFPAMPAEAATLVGPGRFCGYAPIIDLLEGERITTLVGGIHGGSFRWEGAFGTLEVSGIGWASQPKGRMLNAPSDTTPARFAEQKDGKTYQIAIWNGAHGAAYFRSPKRLTALQSAAIDRVRLFEEGQSPEGCKLRTVFVWE